MTVAEMNDVVQHYCTKVPGEKCNDNCAIKEVCKRIGGFFLDNEKECKEAYGIISSLPKVPADAVNHPSHYNQGEFEHDGCKGCKHEEGSSCDTPCSHCRGTVHPFDPYYERCPDFYEPCALENPYWERICKLADRQRLKGMETYGQGLECNPAAMLKRIEHLQEELIDGLMYCEWIKDMFALEGEQHDQD